MVQSVHDRQATTRDGVQEVPLPGFKFPPAGAWPFFNPFEMMSQSAEISKRYDKLFKAQMRLMRDLSRFQRAAWDVMLLSSPRDHDD